MPGNLYSSHTQLRSPPATTDLTYGLTNDNRHRYLDQAPDKGNPSSSINAFVIADRNINGPRMTQSPVVTASPCEPAPTDDGRAYRGDINSSDDMSLRNKTEGRINFTEQGRREMGATGVDDDGRPDEGRFAIGSILMEDKNGGTIRHGG